MGYGSKAVRDELLVVLDVSAAALDVVVVHASSVAQE